MNWMHLALMIILAFGLISKKATEELQENKLKRLLFFISLILLLLGFGDFFSEVGGAEKIDSEKISNFIFLKNMELYGATKFLFSSYCILLILIVTSIRQRIG